MNLIFSCFVSLPFVLAIVILLLVIRKMLYKNDGKTVFIVVLGDIGRSPRMNYHCLSLSKLGYSVKFIGYNETKQMEAIRENRLVEIIPLQVFPRLLQSNFTI